MAGEQLASLGEAGWGMGELASACGAAPTGRRPSRGGVRAEGTVLTRSMGSRRSAAGLTGSCLVLQATLRRRPPYLETRAMWGSRELLLLWFLVLATGGTEHVYRPG